jgi:hypothetical protein
MPAVSFQPHSDTCCLCHGEGGLVWNVPGYDGLWVHLNCSLEAQQQEKEKFSEQHLATARQEGKFLIGQTKSGTVRLTYHKRDRFYTLDQMPTNTKNPYSIRLAQGKKDVVKPILMRLYQVKSCN